MQRDTTPYSFPQFEAAGRLPSWLRWFTWTIVAVLLSFSAADYLAVSGADARQDASAEALNLSGRQRMLSQRVAYLSTQAMADIDRGVDPARSIEGVASAMSSLLEDRRRLEALPFSSQRDVHLPSTAMLAEAHQRWRRDVQAGEAAGPSHALLLSQAEAFLFVSEALVKLLQSRADDAQRETQRVHATFMVALFGMVSLFTLVIGEALALRMRDQHDRMSLQAAELERLAMVAERTMNAVIIADHEGRVVWANDAFTRISGYPLVEVIGRKPGRLLQFEGTDPETQGKLRDALARLEPVQVEILNRGKGGRLYWLNLDIQPLRDDDGRCKGFVAVETDVTEQTIERRRLETLLRTLPAGVVEQGPDGRITDCNPEACRILGLSRDQLLGRASIDSSWRTVHEDGSAFPGEEHPAMVALRERRPVRGVAMGVALPTGDRRWLRVNAEPVFGPDGDVLQIVSSFVDITETSSQRRLLSLTVDAAGLGTWDWNILSGSVRFNDRWWEMLGYEPGHLPSEASTWESLVHPDDLPMAQALIERHLKDTGQPYRCEFRMRTAQGEWMWIMAAGAVIESQEDGSPLRMAGVHLDISQRKSLERRLEDAAYTDALTGMPNRASLQARLRQCAQRAGHDPEYAFALLFMDFDRFKQVNDSLGHDAGDELLRQIAQRLRATLRPGDDLARLDGWSSTAARLGGDEFVVLLEPLRRTEDAVLVAQRLLDALARPYLIHGHDVFSTASIGIVTSDRDDHDPEAMLRDADTAMYEAKRRGRGRFVVFSTDMHDKVRAALDLEADLRRALDAGEVGVAYQPIVDARAGRIVGTETLARWRHPVRGEVPPSEFIPMAEDCGLIESLGEQVLVTACADLAR